MSTYTVSEFAKMIGVSVKTLQRWDREGTLVPSRTPTNRRVYTDEHFAEATGIVNTSQERKIIAYIRVSSQAQKPDLENQRLALEQFCIARGLVVDEWIDEIGGGLNFKRPKFVKLIDKILAGSVGVLVVAHKDRLSRFGFDLLEHLCHVYRCELIVMNIESLSPEQEMVQDMMAIVHCFSSRLYGLRNYRKSLQKALEDDSSAQDSAKPNA